MITKEKILDANRRTHRVEAPVYDTIHGEIFNCYAQSVIRRLLKLGIDSLKPEYGSRTPRLTALDCASGTGNISEKLLALGCTVNAVDISHEMLSVLDSKLKSRYDGSYKIIHSDIDLFLDTTENIYDVISFSSALHHLPDYVETFSRAINKLRRPGVIFIIHEPLPQHLQYASTFSDYLRKFDRIVWKYSGKVLRRKGMAEAISEEDADLRDFHAHRGGINPEILSQTVQAQGGKVIKLLMRSENMRHWWSAWLDNALDLRQDEFHMLIHLD